VLLVWCGWRRIESAANQPDPTHAITWDIKRSQTVSILISICGLVIFSGDADLVKQEAFHFGEARAGYIHSISADS
jgi:hypothetical protein